MKTITMLLVGILLGLTKQAAAQTSVESKQLILDFIEYSQQCWNIDTLLSKYLFFREEESKIASKIKRKKYIELMVQQFSDEVKKGKINLEELSVASYENAESSLKILDLGLGYSTRAFVVTNKDRSFTKYFLIRNRKIESFALFQNKAFLLLN